MKNPIRALTLLSASALCCVTAATAQDTPRVTPMTPDVVDKYEQVLPSADFIRREAMIPMRDGVKLYTTIVMKKGTRDAPILLSRTPYDAYDATHRIPSSGSSTSSMRWISSSSKTTTSASHRTSAACIAPRASTS